MKIFIMMSWRNLWRHRRRSVVVISSIGVGIFSMIFSMGFMNGMNVQMVENTISTSLGHVAVHKKGFQDNMKLENNFIADDAIYKALREAPAVVAFAPKIKVQGMVRSSETSRGVLIIGIDPEKEKKISKIYDYTSKDEGSAFLDDMAADEVLISKAMAGKLDLVVGDRLVLMVQDKHREIIGEGLMVKGIFESPVDSFDKYVVFVGLKKLQEVTGLGDGISELTVLVKNKDRVRATRDYIRNALKDRNLEVLSWQDMAPNLVRAIALFDMIMYIFFAIVFVTVIFSVANTLIMAILERFHEIGVMKSIGTRPSWIFFMIMFEAVNLGFVGLAMGILAGVGITGLLGFTGIDFSFYMESMRTWGTGSIIYPAIKILDLIVAVIIVLLTTVIAALYPAVKAARIRPLEALHFI
ncbi:MAG: hypothetical protein CVV44_16885 [Spirochaetae bacterium HGW-Spirochaetae-1]|jgi:ABC-type lipoprotein release transport system permease subunit|nr:MAG: hypothetical protein CVV44_16885 [Spirochaetae bacterium HGW-Spirochaetae-1]